MPLLALAIVAACILGAIFVLFGAAGPLILALVAGLGWLAWIVGSFLLVIVAGLLSAAVWFPMMAVLRITSPALHDTLREILRDHMRGAGL